MLPLEVEDLILLYLDGFEEFRDEEEVPYGLTPRGITKAVGINETEPYETLNEMSEEGMIEGDTREITSADRVRNVYFLSEKGKERVKKVWNEIKDKTIKMKTEEEEKELKVKKLENHISGRNPILKGLATMEDDKKVDITNLDTDFEVFVGRKKELNHLKEKLKQVKKEGVETVLIEGKAGIGKTSLVTKLIPFTEELGFNFLSGTCQSETSDPYLPFKEAFSEYMEEGSSGQGGGAGMAFMGAGQGQKAEDKKMFDAKKKETFYETTNYVKEIAEKDPLVIFLDDLQWVDKATLDILSYMNEKLEEDPVFFIGTYRPEDISEDHHLTEMMHRLGRRNSYEKIELEPLSYENTREIVQGVLGKEDIPLDFIKQVHDKTEGNPLFIKESIRQMLDDGIIDPEEDKYPERGDDISFSEMVQNVIERRVNRLDDETIKIIEMGSIIGGEIPFDILSKTADMDEIDILDHIDMLIGNQLWEEDPNQEAFYFSHELIEETVYGRIKGLKKKLLHKKVAKNIEELYGDQIENWYSDLARHYEGGEEYSEALDYYLKAGEKAESVYANEDAIEMYEKALDLTDEVPDSDLDRLNIIEKIAEAYSLLGKYEKARQSLERGLDRTEEEEKEQRLYRKIADTFYKRNDYEEALRHIEKGLEKGEENTEVCKMLSIKGWTYLQRGKLDKAREIFEEEKDIAEKVADQAAIGQVYHDLGTVFFQTGSYEEGIEKLQEAIEIREENDIKRELMKSLNNIGIAYSDKGDWDNAEKYYERSLQVSEEMGDKSGVSTTLNNMAIVHSKKGDIEKSIERYKKCLEMNKKIEDRQGKAISLGNLGEMNLMKGDLEQAEDQIKKSKEIQEKIDDKPGIQVNLTNLGALNQMKGNLDKAEEYYDRSLEKAREIGSKRSETISLQSLGELFVLKGKFDQAEEEFKDARKLAKEIGSKDTEAEIIDGLAKVYRLRGDHEEAENLHEEGIEKSAEINDEETKIMNKMGLAEDLFEKGDLEKGLEISKKMSEILKDRGDPSLLVRNNIIKSKIYREMDEFEEAEELFEDTVEKIDDIGEMPWKGRALYEYGMLHSKMENEEEAEKKFEEAMDIFEEIGMEHWKKKTADELDERGD